MGDRLLAAKAARDRLANVADSTSNCQCHRCIKCGKVVTGTLPERYMCPCGGVQFELHRSIPKPKSAALAIIAAKRLFGKAFIKKPGHSALARQNHASAPDSPRTVNAVQLQKDRSSLSEQLHFDVQAIQRVKRECQRIQR